MKGPSSFQPRSIRSSPLPMGDQEFETQRRFLHKDPNNGSQRALLYMSFYPPSNFLLLEAGGRRLNETGFFSFIFAIQDD